MHVLCPSCTTVYEIPTLQRPRKLRCARCATEWRAMPESGDELPASPPPEPEDMAREPEAAPAQVPEPIALEALTGLEGRIGASVIAAPASGLVLWSVLWVVSLLAIAAWMAALWHWRGPIGHGWPPSLRLYRLLPGAAMARTA